MDKVPKHIIDLEGTSSKKTNQNITQTKSFQNSCDFVFTYGCNLTFGFKPNEVIDWISNNQNIMQSVTTSQSLNLRSDNSNSKFLF